jgi:hypothetical protein
MMLAVGDRNEPSLGSLIDFRKLAAGGGSGKDFFALLLAWCGFGEIFAILQGKE